MQTDLYDADCWTQVVNDSSIVSLVSEDSLDHVKRFELHTSGEFITSLYAGFQIRWDWPLEENVNKILSIMVEADVIQPWDAKCKPVQLSDFKYDQEVQNNKNFKPIELNEVAFAFVILAVGLACATIVFVIEVAISPT